MNIHEQINQYIGSLPGPKRNDIETLHNRILQLLPTCKLWFLDGKDENGKIVTNPNMPWVSNTKIYQWENQRILSGWH